MLNYKNMVLITTKKQEIVPPAFSCLKKEYDNNVVTGEFLHILTINVEQKKMLAEVSALFHVTSL